jgi:uncharacterized protein with HEPN domain
MIERNERIQKYLQDILNAILDVEEFTKELISLSDYSRNKMAKMATERELITIGEAINRILVLNPDIKISSARRIVQFRNKITHEYDAVDDSQVWVIIRRYIPVLKIEISDLVLR